MVFLFLHTKIVRARYIFRFLAAFFCRTFRRHINFYVSSICRLSDDYIYILQTQYRNLTIPNDAQAQQELAEDFYLYQIRIGLEENNNSFTKDVSLSAFGLPATQ